MKLADITDEHLLQGGQLLVPQQRPRMSRDRRRRRLWRRLQRGRVERGLSRQDLRREGVGVGFFSVGLKKAGFERVPPKFDRCRGPLGPIRRKLAQRKLKVQVKTFVSKNETMRN